jgi:sterol desaturase/sphingolipid hydroxylase (fatty acid hydroxylase superfamily)
MLELLPGWLDLRNFLLFLLIFSPLEYILPIHERAKLLRRGWGTDVLHFFLSGIFIKLGLILVLIFSVQLGSSFIPTEFQAWLGSIPTWLQIIVAIIIADFGFYLSHRLMHAVPVLWRFHAVHHSSEKLDWLASYRVHPVDQVIVKGSSLVPIFALGFSDTTIIITTIIYQWQALLLHSNVNVKIGPLKWIIASPEFHHWHHANHEEAYDKNFAGQLSFWDWLFGTAYINGGRPETYGVDEHIPEGYIQQLAYPFQPGHYNASPEIESSDISAQSL